MDKSCTNPDCTVAQTGKCLLNHALDACPNLAEANSASTQPAFGLPPVLVAPDSNVRLPPSLALDRDLAVRGELWKKVVSSSEIPPKWLEIIKGTESALLFVRALCEENCDPLDWVTAKELLASGLGENEVADAIPTQVSLCELLRMLEDTLSRANGKPKVAIIVTAWDALPPDIRTQSPLTYIQEQFPLFAGRLRDSSDLHVRAFGLSILGGDVGNAQFRDQYLNGGGLKGAGYVIFEENGQIVQDKDVTHPIQWLIT